MRAGNTKYRLLELHLGASILELLLHLLGIGLGDPLFQRLRGSLDQVLRLFEAETGDLANHLDDVDLVRARSSELDVEFGLLFDGSGCGGRAGGGTGGYGDRRSLDAPL